MPSDPKRHHYIPQFLLRRFVDELGRLYFFDSRIPDGKVRDAIPEELFFQKHLYSALDNDGARNPALERRLSKFEAKVAPVTQKIVDAVRGGELPGLDEKERNLWRDFFIIQWRRTPDVLSRAVNEHQYEEKLNEILQEVRRNYPEKSEEISKLDHPEARRWLIHNAKIDAIVSPKSMLKELLNSRGIAYARIPDAKKCFVIGSTPITITRSNPQYSSDAREIEAWLPIAPDVAVGIGDTQHMEIIYSIDDHSLIRKVNRRISSQSTIFASRSFDLTTSLRRAK